MRIKALALLALTLLFASTFAAAVPATTGASITEFIRDVNSYWGTPGSSTGAAPGDMNVPLTVTFQYTYPETASSVQGLLGLPSGFALYDGTNQTFASSSNAVSDGSAFQLTFEGIFISKSLALGSYNFTLNLAAYSESGLLLEQSMNITASVEGRPQLQVTTTTESLSTGQVNTIPIMVSNIGSGNASKISLVLSAAGVSVLTPTLTAQTLEAGQNASLSAQVYVPGSQSGSAVTLLATATYYDPYGYQQSSSQTIGFYATAPSTTPLYFQADIVALVPGTSNSVPITLTNQGNVPIQQIHTTISSSSQVSVLTQFPFVAELGPNASTRASVEIFVPASSANSPLTLTISYSYDDGQTGAGSYTQVMGLYTSSSNASLASVSVSVTPVKSTAKVGVQSVVSFDVENVGPVTLGSPVISLGVSSPLVVIQNSSYAVPGGALESGETVAFNALVGSSTSASPGYYPASVTITYVDQSGTVQSATFTSAVVLSGTVDLVLQSPQVTQSNSTIAVSGEILNEGFSSAYYATATGSIVGTKTTSQADYVGEIDPNTPVPFSFTLTYSPQRSSRAENISVAVSFRDSLGIQGVYSSSFQTTLSATSTQGTSTSSSSSSSGVDLLTYLEVVVIVVLVAIGVAGFVYIRRSRRSTGLGEARADQGVI